MAGGEFNINNQVEDFRRVSAGFIAEFATGESVAHEFGGRTYFKDGSPVRGIPYQKPRTNRASRGGARAGCETPPLNRDSEKVFEFIQTVSRSVRRLSGRILPDFQSV